MKTKQIIFRNETEKYAAIGVAFGLTFPITATVIQTVIASMPLTLSNVIEMQRSDPLLWIIDSAPVFLGLFAALAGKRQDRAQNLNKELRESESQLRGVQETLERRVEARTQELRMASQRAERRAEQLQNIAQIVSETVSIRSLDQLLEAVPDLIQNHFGFHTVDVFLIDGSGEFLVFQATNQNNPQARQRLETSFKMNEQGLLTDTVRKGQPTFLPFSAVPVETTLSQNTELVLPLRTASQVIGVLDLYTDPSRTISSDDIQAFSILADQLALSIQNSLLYQASQQALIKADLISGKNSVREWNEYTETRNIKGYRFDGVRSFPLHERTSSTKQSESELLQSIRVRDQAIGRLRLKSLDPSRTWNEDETEIIKATAERVAIALEGVRLLENAQKRVSRESFLSEIAAKLGSSFKMDSILRDTVTELGIALGDPTITFQLVDPVTKDIVQPKTSFADSGKAAEYNYEQA